MSFPHDLTGSLLDRRYQINGLLGKGGMGHVYDATHVALDQRVAIKVLHPRFAHEQRFRDRFIREAQSASKIKHRNVVQITDFGDTPDGSVYFVMEFLEGHDIGVELRRVQRMKWPRTRHLLLQAVGALRAAHGKDIIHRDIKPANCFLTTNREEGVVDRVKLLDFGIAKVGRGAHDLTGTGEIFGTATYMSPEQARGDELDHRSDMYSLGVMAYQMLVGRVPFQGVNAIHVIGQHIKDAPQPLREIEGSISIEVEALVLKMLAKQPGERYASMGDLEKALQAFPESVGQRGRRTVAWTGKGPLLAGGSRVAGAASRGKAARPVAGVADERTAIVSPRRPAGGQRTTSKRAFNRPSAPPLSAARQSGGSTVKTSARALSAASQSGGSTVKTSARALSAARQSGGSTVKTSARAFSAARQSEVSTVKTSPVRRKGRATVPKVSSRAEDGDGVSRPSAGSGPGQRRVGGVAPPRRTVSSGPARTPGVSEPGSRVPARTSGAGAPSAPPAHQAAVVSVPRPGRRSTEVAPAAVRLAGPPVDAVAEPLVPPSSAGPGVVQAAVGPVPSWVPAASSEPIVGVGFGGSNPPSGSNPSYPPVGVPPVSPPAGASPHAVASTWASGSSGTGPVVPMGELSAETRPQVFEVAQPLVTGRMIVVGLVLVILVGGGSALFTMALLRNGQAQVQVPAARVVQSESSRVSGSSAEVREVERVVGSSDVSEAEAGELAVSGASGLQEQEGGPASVGDGIDRAGLVAANGEVDPSAEVGGAGLVQMNGEFGPLDGVGAVVSVEAEGLVDPGDADEIVMDGEESESESEPLPESASVAPNKPKPPAHESEACMRVREEAEAAYRVRRWPDVLAKAKKRKCWPLEQRERRLTMVIQALMERERFADCIKAGRRSSSANIKKMVAVCEKRIGA